MPPGLGIYSKTKQTKTTPEFGFKLKTIIGVAVRYAMAVIPKHMASTLLVVTCFKTFPSGRTHDRP